MFSTEFKFTLPKGYLDEEGTLHRSGTMRLAKAIDEITPLEDPRVQANPAYATVMILARVVTQLGLLNEISPMIIENLYASDLNYLYNLYRQVNDLNPDVDLGQQQIIRQQRMEVEPESAPMGQES
ncbi:MAG: hypothetical protein AAGD25_02850 [Cyanobacteria bacterium P01_F01_bin.150]